MSENVNNFREPVDASDLTATESVFQDAVEKSRSGDYHGALDGFRMTLELTKRFFGESIEFAAYKRELSDLYQLSGDLSSAISELSGAAEAMEHMLGKEHDSVRAVRQKLERLRGEQLRSCRDEK